MGWDHATTRGAPPPPERVRLKSAMPSMTRRRTSSSRLCPAALMALDAAFAFASWLVVLNYTAGSSHVESHGCDAASSTPSGNAARVVARPRHSPPILSRCGFLLCPRFSVSWGWRAVARDAIFQARTPLPPPSSQHQPSASCVSIGSASLLHKTPAYTLRRISSRAEVRLFHCRTAAPP